MGDREMWDDVPEGGMKLPPNCTHWEELDPDCPVCQRAIARKQEGAETQQAVSAQTRAAWSGNQGQV
jgi:hypothetical protein